MLGLGQQTQYLRLQRPVLHGSSEVQSRSEAFQGLPGLSDLYIGLTALAESLSLVGPRARGSQDLDGPVERRQRRQPLPLLQGCAADLGQRHPLPPPVSRLPIEVQSPPLGLRSFLQPAERALDQPEVRERG